MGAVAVAIGPCYDLFDPLRRRIDCSVRPAPLSCSPSLRNGDVQPTCRLREAGKTTLRNTVHLFPQPFLRLQLRPQSSSKQQAQYESAVTQPTYGPTVRITAYELALAVCAAATAATNEHLSQLIDLVAGPE